ncbi:MAG TPA: ROK family protein [Oxalicibacterium sp.]
MPSSKSTQSSFFIGGLDIGGTKMAATVADRSGPLARVVEPTAKTGTEYAPAEQAVRLLKDACAKAGVPFEELDTVGVSSCGPFIRQQGRIRLAAPNICGGIARRGELPNDWMSVPLEEVLRRHFVQVVIRNDCVAALTAERAFGNLQGVDDCAYVTWSTGIGFGLCVDGRLLHGKNGNAGHAGHMLMTDQSSAQCGCGNYGDVEALVSGYNLEARCDRPPAELFDAARAGDPQGRAVIGEAAKWFGRALFNVTAALDIERFVIGGAIWHHHGEWLEPMVMSELCTRLPALTNGVSLSSPGLDSLVTDIGALHLVMPEDWPNEWRARKPWQQLQES